MSLLSNLFNKNEGPANSHAEFWKWFEKYEKEFYKVVKDNDDIESNFFDKVSVKLSGIVQGFFFLTGIGEDKVASLVISTGGNVSNFALVEELVAAAPQISRWRFTALIPEKNIEDASLEENGYTFNASNLYFLENSDPDFPDEIDISITHDELTEQNRSIINNGIFSFLDNYLGELTLAVVVDNIVVTGKDGLTNVPRPISELKDYLTARQQALEEKYKDTYYDAGNEKFSVLQINKEGATQSVGVINTDLLQWDNKPSHPWLLKVEIASPENDEEQSAEKAALPNTIEERLTEALKKDGGVLKIGHLITGNLLEIFFACRHFRTPVLTAKSIQAMFSNQVDIDYELYLDKYWHSLQDLNPAK